MATVQTPKELGLAIRARRKEIGWDQATLAEQTGVTRQWVIDIEKGKPRAELGLAMRAMRVMGMLLIVEIGDSTSMPRTSAAESGKAATEPPSIDINAIAENKGARAAGIALEDSVSDLGKSLANYENQSKTLKHLVEQASYTLPSSVLDYLAEVQTVAHAIKQTEPQLTPEFLDAMKLTNEMARTMKGLALPSDLATQIEEINAATRTIEQASQLLPRTAVDYLNQGNLSNQFDDFLKQHSLAEQLIAQASASNPSRKFKP